MLTPNAVLIVGAGFSANAGLPLASQFTAALLNTQGLSKSGPSARQVAFIREFVDTTFGEGKKRTVAQWPELEDIFTLVDLAANTGHNLGPKYAASHLRTLRRAILVRMIRMLDQKYRAGSNARHSNWQKLERLFGEFNYEDASVLSMNWDTVFERGLKRKAQISSFDYGCNAYPAMFRTSKLQRKNATAENVAHIIKPHGSVNWLYCDACRELFWLPPSETQTIARILFRPHDWATLKIERSSAGSKVIACCPECKADALSSRFATFSFRKALDFPMFAASWSTAEKHLKVAQEWVFFGYSMPPADFEFKHLLKRVQLTGKTRPRITVITGGDREVADATIERFEKFFGAVSAKGRYFKNGLTDEALNHLRSIGMLKVRTNRRPISRGTTSH